MPKYTEFELEMLIELPPGWQVWIYSQDYACGDADMMDYMEAVGVFQPEM